MDPAEIFREIENMTMVNAIQYLAEKEKQKITREFEQAKADLAERFSK